MIGVIVVVNENYVGYTFMPGEKVRIVKYNSDCDLCYRAKVINGPRAGWLKKGEISTINV